MLLNGAYASKFETGWELVFYFNGNLKHAADDLYNKALKAFFSVKSKFNNFQEVPLKTCLKLFDSLRCNFSIGRLSKLFKFML
jgi:hypothetical protein